MVYIAGLLPAASLFYRAFFDLLGVDPLKTLEHELGEYALILLIFLLFFSPIKKFTKINLMKFRRSIGLLSFWYVFFHLFTYLFIDQQLIWELIVKDVTKRPYIIVGFLGFVALIPLALTSNKWSKRFLGAANWKTLHLLVYFAAFFGVLHYLLLVKSWPIKPLLYFFIVFALIIFRFSFKNFYRKIN